ncbi:UNVERIFIED_CONTAM: hypothetical protein Sradi_2056500, partial [Sesamum radiatum]
EVCVEIKSSTEGPAICLEGARNALLAQEQLHQHGVRVDIAYSNCLGDVEDGRHLLFACSFARLVWAMSDLPNEFIDYRESNVEGWFRTIHQQCRGPDFDFFFTICWAIWEARNRHIFEGQTLDAYEVNRIARRHCFYSVIFSDFVSLLGRGMV